MSGGRGASDADLYLVSGGVGSALVALATGLLVYADQDSWMVALVAGAGGLIFGVLLAIGVIAKGVEVGNRT